MVHAFGAEGAAYEQPGFKAGRALGVSDSMKAHHTDSAI